MRRGRLLGRSVRVVEVDAMEVTEADVSSGESSACLLRAMVRVVAGELDNVGFD